MNYEAERAMNQKRLRMEGEPGHGVVQGNGLPLNYMDNGHQIPYQPYAGAYNTHYPPPDAFAAYGPPPPGGYAPQNLSYAPPAHQNYPSHHQSFPPQQPPQTQLHMPQSHMVQGYGTDVGVHKPAWAPQPHLLPPIDTQKPLDVKQLKPEIKLEPNDSQKRPHPTENEMMAGDLEQPKIKIKTDIFKPDDLAQNRPDIEKPHDISQKSLDTVQKPLDQQRKDDVQLDSRTEDKPGDKTVTEGKADSLGEHSSGETPRPSETAATPSDKSSDGERKVSGEYFSTPGAKPGTTPGKPSAPGTEPKKRGRPKGSTNKPKPPGMATPNKVLTPNTPNAPAAIRAPTPAGVGTPRATPIGRPRATAYQYAVRPFRKDFSGIQFRRRWSDDCLDSSHIPNEVYFGDVPVSMEVLFNYYDANAEREKLAAQAAQIAAQKAAAAKLAAAKLQARGLLTNEVTTVDSSSSDSSEGSSGSDSDDTDDMGKRKPVYRKQTKKILIKCARQIKLQRLPDLSNGTIRRPQDLPLKRGPGRPKGVKSTGTPRPKSTSTPGTPGRRGRPPVPPELREPGITEMKKFCKAAGIRFDYKKLVEGCTKNKERVGKMMDLLVAAGLEGKPTIEKCKELKKPKAQKKESEKRAKKEAKTKAAQGEEGGENVSRRMTRGQTGVKPRQKIVISSDEDDDLDARRTLAKLRAKQETDSN